jgi:uncharacterized membrane protein YecN with MAPEG domain
MMPIVPLYAALFGLFFVFLSVRTLLLRRTLGIAVGDGGNQLLLRASRVHSNFAEYVPLSLLLVFFVESQGYPNALVHTLCISLFAGRISHAFGVSRTPENYRYRVFGMAMTFFALVAAALTLLSGYVRHFVA